MAYPTLDQVAKVVANFIYVTFFGILFTILRPIGVWKNAELKNQARQLNIQAAKDLNCDAQSVFVRLDNGIHLHAVEAGKRSDKLLVLIHGFPECWISWSHLIPALVKNDFFVVAIDMRGYNLSDKPAGVGSYKLASLVEDIEDLLTYYNKKTATVVAHDWGGVVAWAFAEKNPDKTEKLVILNAPHPRAMHHALQTNPSQVLASWYIFFIQIPFLAANLLTYSPYATVERVFKFKSKNTLSQDDKDILASSYVQDGAIPAALNYYKAFIRTLAVGAIHYLLATIAGTGTGNGTGNGTATPAKPSKSSSPSSAHTNGKKSTGKLAVPTLVLWGEDDTALTPELAQVGDYVANLRVQYIPNCSHWVAYDAPDVVEQAVTKFVGEGGWGLNI